MTEMKILPLEIGDVTTSLDVHHDKDVRIFRGEHGELAEALAGTLASLQAWQTHPDLVDSLQAKWVEEQGWEIWVVCRRV